MFTFINIKYLSGLLVQYTDSRPFLVLLPDNERFKNQDESSIIEKCVL